MYYSEFKELIIERAESAGLSDVIKNLTKGIDTNLTRLFDIDGYVPSGGETSKIGFAQQSMRNGGIFVFDEYDSNIDPISENELNEKLLNYKETRIIISHRLSIARETDRIYWIENGKVIEKGTHEDLCSIKCKYSKLYEEQKRILG